MNNWSILFETFVRFLLSDLSTESVIEIIIPIWNLAEKRFLQWLLQLCDLKYDNLIISSINRVKEHKIIIILPTGMLHYICTTAIMYEWELYLVFMPRRCTADQVFSPFLISIYCLVLVLPTKRNPWSLYMKRWPVLFYQNVWNSKKRQWRDETLFCTNIDSHCYTNFG